MKKTIALLAACLLAASVFAGCGNNNASSAAEATTVAAAADDAEDATTVVAAANADAEFDVTGTWTSSAYITADGTEYAPADYAAANGVDEETVTVTYTFDAEGKATCTAIGATVEGTYTVEGTKVKTAFTGSAPEFEYDAEKDTLTNTDPATGIVSVMSRA